jgi:Ca-activated chloride channel homolog
MGRLRSHAVGYLVWALAIVVCSTVLDGRTQAPQVQSTNAVVEGIVIDGQGGVIPGATLRLEQSSRVVATQITNVSGEFRFTNVPHGRYRLRAEMPGFRAMTRDITVTAVSLPRLTLTLQVSGSTEAVTVIAEAPVFASQSIARMYDVQDGARALAPGTEAYAHVARNEFKRTVDDPLSTFAADVDTASYTNVRRFLSKGQLPPADAVRVEELLNYFRFSYPEPTSDRPVSITTQVGACPWEPAHRLMLVGVRAKAIDQARVASRNIVLLIDVSGSMESPDKLPLLQTGLRMFVDTLREQDRVAIVTYAGASGLVLPSTPARQRARIHEAIENLRAGGSTNGGQGLTLAYKVARDEFIAEGVNRVILATDGDFNVGVQSQGDLLHLIEEQKRSGVFLSVLGVGTGNLKDQTMEMLADKGNGHYAYLDSLQEARRVLVKEGGATLETVAKDVKLQLEFNPSAISAWKLIGYENRLLAARDFNDDKKDGGELGAGHTVTVLYEFVPAGAPAQAGSSQMPVSIDPLRYQGDRPHTGPGRAELATVKVRYKKPSEDVSALMETVVTSTAGASGDLGFAATVAQFGMLLGDPAATNEQWSTLVTRVRTDDAKAWPGERAAFAELVETAAGLRRLK